MKIFFKQIIDSDAYQRQSELFVKADIFVAVVTLLYIMIFDEKIFSPWQKIVGFLWAVGGTSLLVSMPFFLVICFFASILSGNSEYPSGKPKNGLGLMSHVMAKFVLPVLSLVVSSWAVIRIMGI